MGREKSCCKNQRGKNLQMKRYNSFSKKNYHDNQRKPENKSWIRKAQDDRPQTSNIKKGHRRKQNKKMYY